MSEVDPFSDDDLAREQEEITDALKSGSADEEMCQMGLRYLATIAERDARIKALEDDLDIQIKLKIKARQEARLAIISHRGKINAE